MYVYGYLPQIYGHNYSYAKRYFKTEQIAFRKSVVMFIGIFYLHAIYPLSNRGTD